MKAYDPTTCLAAGAERGVCICGTLAETEAHCCSAAPPLPALLFQYRSRGDVVGGTRLINTHCSKTETPPRNLLVTSFF